MAMPDLPPDTFFLSDSESEELTPEGRREQLRFFRKLYWPIIAFAGVFASVPISVALQVVGELSGSDPGFVSGGLGLRQGGLTWHGAGVILMAGVGLGGGTAYVIERLTGKLRLLRDGKIVTGRITAVEVEPFDFETSSGWQTTVRFSLRDAKGRDSAGWGHIHSLEKTVPEVGRPVAVLYLNRRTYRAL